MKTTILILTFAALAFGQTKTEVCVRHTDAKGVVTDNCTTVPVQSATALTQFNATQVQQIAIDAKGQPVMGPKYKSDDQVIFSHLNALWDTLLSMYPPKAVADAKAALDAAAAGVSAAKTAALPAIPDK